MNHLKRHLAVLVALVLIALSGYVWGYIRIVSMSNTLAALQEQTAVNEGEGALYLAGKEHSRVEIGEKLVNKYLLTKEDVPSFVDDLEERGRAQGTEVTILSLAEQRSPTRTGFAISLAIEGSFDDVMRTLGTIEYAPYALIVSSATVGYDLGGFWRADVKLEALSSFVL